MPYNTMATIASTLVSSEFLGLCGNTLVSQSPDKVIFYGVTWCF